MGLMEASSLASTPLSPKRARIFGDIPYVSGLPPRDAWLIDPEREKIDTPVNDLGLIDVSRLIEDVKETISPEYEWPTHLSVHHLYFPEAHYRCMPDDPKRVAVRFREISWHKALVPRVFENWLHFITIEAPMPTMEVMECRLDSWIKARRLYQSVRNAVVWEKRARRRQENIENNPDILPEEFEAEDIIGKEILEDILNAHFRGVQRNLEGTRDIPEEFRLVDPESTLDELRTRLGRLVAPKALQLTRTVAA